MPASPLALAREHLRVGNLYLNQVSREHERGYIGSTAQGFPEPEFRPGVWVTYRRQFLWTHVVSENTLRHGFVPLRTGSDEIACHTLLKYV